MKPRSRRRQAPVPAEGRRLRRHLFWLLPGALAVALYLPVLHGPLIWDDSLVLGPQIHAFATARDVLFPPPRIPQWPYSYYRPAVVASYLLDRAIFGSGSTVGPHLMVVLYHAASTIFASLLAAQALRGSRLRRWGALAAGMLFAAHPIHTESVSWITGRSDTLAAMFLFAALLVAVRYRDRRSIWALWVSPLLFLLAALSKEVALAALALLPIWLWLVPEAEEAAPEGLHSAKSSERGRSSGGPGGRLPWRLLAAYGLALLAYLGLRAGAGTETGISRLAGRGVAEAMGKLAAAMAYHVVKVVMPPPQSLLVTKLPGVLLTLVGLVAAVGGLVWAVRRAKPARPSRQSSAGAKAAEEGRRGESVWLLGVAWFGITTIPSLPVAITGLAEAPVAERYLYIPSFGVCLLAGAFLAAAMARPNRRQLAVGIAAAVLALAAAGTLRRNLLWRSDLALWRDTVEKEPSAGLAWSELGKAYLDRQSDLERALQCYEKAISTQNDAMGRAISYNSIGVIQAKRGHEDEALTAWRTAVAERDDYAAPYYNIGNLLANRVRVKAQREGRLDLALLAEARSSLSRAVDLDPRYAKALLRLVWCDVEKGAYVVAAGDPSAGEAALEEAERTRLLLGRSGADPPVLGEADRLLQGLRQALSSRPPARSR